PPLDGSRVRIDGRSDEVQVWSPSLMEEYVGDPDATARAFTEDGWLRTGDAGALDASGYLTLTARLKELIVVHGRKCGPAEIEAALGGCDGVSGLSVVGVWD